MKKYFTAENTVDYKMISSLMLSSLLAISLVGASDSNSKYKVETEERLELDSAAPPPFVPRNPPSIANDMDDQSDRPGLQSQPHSFQASAEFGNFDVDLSPEVIERLEILKVWDKLPLRYAQAWIIGMSQTAAGSLYLFKIYNATQGHPEDDKLNLLRGMFPYVLFSQPEIVYFDFCAYSMWTDTSRKTFFEPRINSEHLLELSPDELSLWLNEVQKSPVLANIYLATLNNDRSDGIYALSVRDVITSKMRNSTVLSIAQKGIKLPEIDGDLIKKFSEPDLKLSELEEKIYLTYIEANPRLLFKILSTIKGDESLLYKMLLPILEKYRNYGLEIQKFIWDKLSSNPILVNTWYDLLYKNMKINKNDFLGHAKFVLHVFFSAPPQADLLINELRQILFGSKDIIAKLWTSCIKEYDVASVKLWAKQLDSTPAGIEWLGSRHKTGALVNYPQSTPYSKQYEALMTVGLEILDRNPRGSQSPTVSQLSSFTALYGSAQLRNKSVIVPPVHPHPVAASSSTATAKAVSNVPPMQQHSDAPESSKTSNPSLQQQ